MKILVFEYVTGGGMRQEPLPPSLALEGEQMLRALTTDLLDLLGTKLVVFRDDRLDWVQTGRPDAAVETVYVEADDDFRRLWLCWVDRCDAVWPIAPETDGILEGLCRDVAACGKTLLNSPAPAVSLAASKLATARRLEQHGLPVIPTFSLYPWQDSLAPPFVIKPVDGVGCEGLRVISSSAEIKALLNEPHGGNRIAQPLLEGESFSLSALFAQGRARLLSCNRQDVARTRGGFHLQGCLVNALADDGGVWQTLADAIARAMPELWGYAGIDFILTEAGPVILEINPRLTTSYAGLREATGENAAALMLNLLATGELPEPRTSPGKPAEVRLETPHAC